MRRKLLSVVLSVGLVVGIGVVGTGSASANAMSTGSIVSTIGHALETAAATAAAAIGSAAPGSTAATRAIPGVSNVVCQIAITYTTAFIPMLGWTYKGSILVPIMTSYAVTTPVQTRICH